MTGGRSSQSVISCSGHAALVPCSSDGDEHSSSECSHVHSWPLLIQSNRVPGARTSDTGGTQVVTRAASMVLIVMASS